MRRAVIGLGIVAVLVGACGGGGSSDDVGERLLFTYTLKDNGGTPLPGISTYAAALGVESRPGLGSYPEVFEDDVLTPASQGTTILSAGDDDIEIPDLVALLTNGDDDMLRVRLSRDTKPGAWQLQPESAYAWEVQRFGPDLVGYTITRFELHVVELRFEVPGNDPNGDGDWQQRFVEVRFEVYGIR